MAELENKVTPETTLPVEAAPEPAPTTNTTKEQPTAEEATPPQAEAEASPAAGQLDISIYEKEYTDTGALSDTTYAALEKAGIPKRVVDNYIAGQSVAVEARLTDVYSSVGGKAEYSALMAWAKDNLQGYEKEAYNKLAATNDTGAIKLMLSGIHSKYQKSANYDPKQVTDGGSKPSSQGYASMAEVVADMKDARYKNDEAYRAKVAAKLSLSNL